MQRVRIQKTATAGVALAAVAVLAACSSSGGGSTTSSGSSSSPSASSAKLSGTLNGSGSTFQTTFQQAAIQAFKAEQPGLTVNYGGGGSGKGRTDLASGVVNYAGSDSTIPAKEASNFKGKTILYFPVVIGPIALSYNLSGVTGLKLDGPTIAKIFQGPDQDLERPGDQGAQPECQAAQHGDHHRPPVGLLGYHRELLPVPGQLRPRRVEARHQLHHQLAVQQPRRHRQRRRATRSSRAPPGAIGYVDFADAKASNLSMASIKNSPATTSRRRLPRPRPRPPRPR